MRRDYIKDKRNETAEKLKKFISEAQSSLSILNGKQKALLSACLVLLLLPVLALIMHFAAGSIATGDSMIISMAGAPAAVATVKRGIISVPSGIVKADPFLPYRDIGESGRVQDVPAYNLIEPPEVINENSDAARLMDTIVSGILFDKYSPSAILNIEGNDYLVKKGDVVNNYKVLNIARDTVTVKLGNNTYTAGIGEMLTEGTIHYNDVPNLKNKFGGAK